MAALEESARTHREAREQEEKEARELLRRKCLLKGDVEGAREKIRLLGMESAVLERDVFNLNRSLNK